MILQDKKDTGLITRTHRYLPRNSLLTIYKAFIRPHLDYGDVIYDYPGNAYFMQKLESVQYIQPAHDVPGTSPEGHHKDRNVQDLQGTLRRTSGDQYKN